MVLLGPLHPNWKGDDISASGMLSRVQRARGHVTRHSCTTCGRQARSWVYDGTDANERPDPAGRFYGLHIEHYEARCVRHKRA